MKFTKLLKFTRITQQTDDWEYDILCHASYVTLAAIDEYFKQCNDHFADFCNKTTPKSPLGLMNSTETTFEEYQRFQATLFPK